MATLVSAQLTTPNLLSNSHWKMTLAVSAGVAQARIRLIESASRIHRPSAPKRSATSVPRIIVSATLNAVKPSVRTATAQNVGSDRIEA